MKALTPLTKPQVKLLTRLMREETAPVAGPTYRVAATLAAQGRCNLLGGMAHETEQGLCALLTFRTRLWGAQGSMASLLNMEEVEAALALRFPEGNA